MIFLNPALLFGLLAASIPVVIHLLNLRKLKKIEFSTLAFLKELEKTKIKKIKIKQWILLALRILIILLLVAAFARPTIKSVSVGGASSAAKTSAVVILDDTYSMSVVTDQGSYFNRCKQTLKSLLNEFQEGDDVAVLFLSGRTAINPTSNFSSVVNNIDDAEISYVDGNIHNSIVKAAQILSESNNYNKEIYLLSDFQKAELKNSETIVSDLSGLMQANTRIYGFDFAEGEQANLALTDLKVNNQIFEKDKLISFSASVKNTSKKTFNNSVASLFINGSRSAQQSFSAGAGETKLINFETTLKDNGLIEVFAELEDDDINYDNKRYISIYVPQKINVLLFYDKLADTKFLELALNGVAGSSPISVQKYPLSRMASINLSNYDAVIIIGSESLNNYERLKQYLGNRGSIFLMPGSETSLNSFVNICRELGISSPVSIAGNPSDNLNNVSFDKVDFQHPVFANLFEKKTGEKKIDSPEINKFLKASISGSGKSIISLIDGSIFLSEYESKGGRVLMLNTAPVLSWSNFPLKGLFAPLMYKSVFYLSSKTKSIKNYNAGDEVLVNINNVPFPQLMVEKPLRGQEKINLDSLGIKNYLKYTDSRDPGIYKFYSGGKLLDYASVNFNARESDLNYLSNNEFEEYLKELNFTGTYLRISPDDNFKAAIYQSRFGAELWRYFVLAAMLVALIEMFISRTARKDMV